MTEILLATLIGLLVGLVLGVVAGLAIAAHIAIREQHDDRIARELDEFGAEGEIGEARNLTGLRRA